MIGAIKAPVAYSAGMGNLMQTHVTQIIGAISGSHCDSAFFYHMLLDELEWRRAGDNVPRLEYYYDTKGRPYTYGKGEFARTYESQAEHPLLSMMFAILNTPGAVGGYQNLNFDAVFMNYYADQHQHLGWHADDSPEMDATHPIAVVSFGAERQIWFRENGATGTDFERVTLEHGSLLIMEAGMQQTHQHRIPKHDRPCDGRISLTFRKFA